MKSQNVAMDTPWDILYADHFQIPDNTRFGADKRFSEWTCAQKSGLRVSRDKTEYLSTIKATNASIDLQGLTFRITRTLKYLGSTLNEEANCEDEVRDRIGAVWSNWPKVSLIFYDRKMPERMKHRVYEASPTSTVIWSGNLFADRQMDYGRLN